MSVVISMTTAETAKRINRATKLAKFFDMRLARQPGGLWLLEPLSPGTPPFDTEPRTLADITAMLKDMIHDHQHDTQDISTYPMVAITSTGSLTLDNYTVEIWWTPGQIETVGDNLNFATAVKVCRGEAQRVAEIERQRIAEALE